jgi:uncharacterized protein (TIGR02118 family)
MVDTCSLESQSAMIKLLTFLKPVSGLSHEEFRKRWLTVHAPMAASFPGLRGYMLSFSIEGVRDPPANGVAQLWFDSRQSVQRSYATERGRAGSADANQYLSRRAQMLASETWLSNQHSLADMPFKYLLGSKRRKDMSRDEFVDWWTGPFGAEVAEAGRAYGQARLAYDEAGKLLNSGTSGNLELLDKEGVFDGLAELWFPDLCAMRQIVPALALRERCRALGHVTEELLLEEHVIVRPPAPAYGAE